VRIHDCRLASTTIDNGSSDVSFDATTEADGAGLDGDEAADAAAGVDDAVDRAFASPDEVLCPRIHQTEPPKTTTPTATNSATNARNDRFDGTGTESLGNGEDNSTRDAPDDIDGSAAIDSNWSEDSNGRWFASRSE
jgi:hypothetical protein